MALHRRKLFTDFAGDTPGPVKDFGGGERGEVGRPGALSASTFTLG